MINARISYGWADGNSIDLEVETDSPPHPDLLDELVNRVLTLWRETVQVE